MKELMQNKTKKEVVQAINIEENPMAVPNSKIRNGFFILTINSKNLAVSF